MTYGGWLTIAVLLPNLLWVLFPAPSQKGSAVETRSRWVTVVQVIERFGQAAIFILPFFYQMQVSSAGDAVCLALLLITLAGYYAGWWRYFRRDRQPVWLHRRLLGLPLPMNILPACSFLCGAVLMRSPYLAAAAILFGMAHVFMGNYEHRQLEPAS